MATKKYFVNSKQKLLGIGDGSGSSLKKTQLNSQNIIE